MHDEFSVELRRRKRDEKNARRRANPPPTNELTHVELIPIPGYLLAILPILSQCNDLAKMQIIL
jgi:hypothetical protein